MSPTTIARRARRHDHNNVAGSSQHPQAERSQRLNAWALTMANASPASSLSLASVLSRTGV